MVALTGTYWLDVRKPKREEVAAHLVNLAWNGLSGLEPKPYLTTDYKARQKELKAKAKEAAKEAKETRPRRTTRGHRGRHEPSDSRSRSSAVLSPPRPIVRTSTRGKDEPCDSHSATRATADGTRSGRGSGAWSASSIDAPASERQRADAYVMRFVGRSKTRCGPGDPRRRFRAGHPQGRPRRGAPPRAGHSPRHPGRLGAGRRRSRTCLKVPVGSDRCPLRTRGPGLTVD